jgi:hypothetical protein
MTYHARLTRLEAHRHQQRPPGHFTSIVRVPPEIPSAAWDAWLAEHPCACGVVGCLQRRIGLLLPTRLTPEEWQRRYGRQDVETAWEAESYSTHEFTDSKSRMSAGWLPRRATPMASRPMRCLRRRGHS